MDGTNDQSTKKVLPEFVWLLRNVHYTIQDSFENPLSPTKYVTSLNETTSKLLQRFPTFKCFTIPPPSDEVSILTNITANHDNLSAVFNEKVDSTIHWLKRNLKAKAVGSSATKCDGKMLSYLMEQYFAQINDSSGEIPSFQTSWLKAIELRLMKLADSLVSEYDRDMQVELEGKLPMVEGTMHGETGETLMNIHLQVFAEKRLHLQKEMERFQTSEFCGIDPDPLSSFEKKIAEYVSGKVVGGQLFKFVEQNIKASEKYCASAYYKLYKKMVQPKVEGAKNNQIPATIGNELDIFRTSYFKLAKGPATDYIFKERRTDSETYEAELSLIPGPVQVLNVVEAESGTDHIKLKWERPEVNAAAVKKYVVMKRFKGKNWEVIATERNCSALVTGLQSVTYYEIAVFAASEKYIGMEAAMIKAKTAMGRVANVALCASAVVVPPVVLPSVLVQFARADEEIRNEKGTIGLFSAKGTLIGLVPGLGHVLALQGALRYAECSGDAMNDKVFHSIPEVSIAYEDRSTSETSTMQTATSDSICSDYTDPN